MRTKNYLFFPLLLMMILCFSTVCFASDTTGYANPDTGYQVVISDEADLLSAEEEAKLTQYMQPITLYGNAVFKTITTNDFSASYYADACYKEFFEYDSGTLFLIDMANREIYIYNEGNVAKTVTSGYSYTITDNVYLYASDGDYFTCAAKAFEQIYTLLTEGKIAQPMKYICNFMLAILFAILINFFIAYRTSKIKTVSVNELLNNTGSTVNISNAHATFTGQTRIYSPKPKSSGSSGGGGGGGRSSSSSGGGHKF